VLPPLVIADPVALAGRSAARVSAIGDAARPSGWVQSYVRDGEPRAELLVMVDGDDPRWEGIDGHEATVGDQPVLEQAVTDGPRRVRFEVGGRVVAVSALGLTDAELADVVTGLTLAPSQPTAVPGHLPAGMVLVASAPGPLATAVAYRTNYAGDGWFVEMNVDAAVPLAADPASPGDDAPVEVHPVGGAPAMLTEVPGAASDSSWYLLSWWRPEGVHVSLLTQGLSRERVVELAGTVRLATPQEWGPSR
jgi:hypothetical protein